jgi:hypothetical protein
MKFLEMRTRSALRKNKHLRASTAYKHAKHVGVIFSVEDRQKHTDVKDFVHRLEQDGKTVQVLEFLPKKKENYEFLFDFFTMEDLSFWGNITSTQAVKFSEAHFDYLFYTDTVPNRLIMNLLARSAARCRVGVFQETNNAFFELMIEHKGTTKTLLDNMYKYTRLLK